MASFTLERPITFWVRRSGPIGQVNPAPEAIVVLPIECGFFDQSHFTKAFNALERIPPSRYKRRARGGQPRISLAGTRGREGTVLHEVELCFRIRHMTGHCTAARLFGAIGVISDLLQYLPDCRARPPGVPGP